MVSIPLQRIKDYRVKAYRSRPGLRLHTKEEAIDFVNERGFIYFWPIKDVELPSLWVAVAGDRPVADAHDDPGHVTWGWKDSLLGTRSWYYAKVLRKRSTLISLDALPCFYALSENYGSPEDDHLIQYEQGRLTQEARQVYEALLVEGPLDTIALRRAARLASRESDNRFNRALADLQADFKILPVGVAEAGAWHYAFIYEIVPRHYPDLIEQTRFINDNQARDRLARLYVSSVGAFKTADLVKLFGWTRPQAEATADRLVQAGVLSCLQVENQTGVWFGLPDLVSGSTSI
jgi:hypothetical protein